MSGPTNPGPASACRSVLQDGRATRSAETSISPWGLACLEPVLFPSCLSLSQAQPHPGSYVVIWDSRKMRMKTSSAGRAEANIIQMGKWEYKPSGWMTQPRAELLDNLKPLGTLSFCGRGMLVRGWQGKGGDGELAFWAVGK